MADSLRDQLIAAGYQAPKKAAPKKPAGKKSNTRNQKAAGSKESGAKHRGGNKPQPGRNQTHANSTPKGPSPQHQTGKRKATSSQPADLEAIEERKKLKAKIKVLIDENKADAWKGEIVYRYLVDNRIRELYVTEDFHKKLAERELSVTRLNGDTFLVPREIALNIKEINPQWSVFNLESNETATAAAEETEKEYAEFQVPDDLKW